MSAKRVFTHPASDLPALRGRAYLLPFAQVWRAALDLARSRRGWTVVEADPAAGEIRAEARTPVRGRTDDVLVRLSLDPHGLTRVDVVSESRARGPDFGANVRRIARFLHGLDHLLDRTPTRVT